MHLKTFAAAAALTVLIAGAAHAATLHFAATLNGATEAPATDFKGTGQLTATLDTTAKVLTYDVTYSGLTGAATAAHFHGPAMAGVNAGPVVPVPANLLASSPIHGTATLTDAQIADLQAGKWYFNIHTAAHGGGEIRGQVMTAP